MIRLDNRINQNSLVVSAHSFYNLFKKARRSSLFGNAFYLMLNSAVTSLLGFVFWNIAARFFTPGQVGIGSALVAVSGLVGVLANLGLGTGLIRFVPEVKEKAGRLINSSFILSGGLALFGSLIYLAGVGYWSPALGFLRENFWLLFLFVVFTIATALSCLTDYALVAGRKTRYIFYKNTLYSLIKLPLPVFVFSSLGGYGIFAGVGAGYLVGVLLALFLFLPLIYRGYSPRLAYEKDLMRQVLPYSFANYLAGLLNNVPYFIYPLMVLNLLGPEKNAYFTIAWMMIMVIAVIPVGVAQSLFAEGSHDLRKLKKNGRRALFFALIISLPAVGAMVLFGGQLLHLFGADYAKYGAGALRFLALATIPQCVNELFIAINQVKKRINLVIAQTGMLATIALGLGYWLLGKADLSGLGMAYTLAHLFVALAVAWPMWKALNEKQVDSAEENY